MRNRRIDPNSVRSREVNFSSERSPHHDESDLPDNSVSNLELLRGCFEHASIGFSVMDLDGRLLDVNPAFCSITGYSKTELLGKYDLQSLTHPDDLIAVIQRIDALISGQIGGLVMKKRYIQKGGGLVWVQNSTSLIRDQNGNPTHLVKFTEDITERKVAQASLQEAQLRNERILASVSDIHIILDCQWRFVNVNEAAVEAIGRPREEILKLTLWEMYPDIIGTELESRYRRAMDRGIPAAFKFHDRTLDTWWENRVYPIPEGLAVFANDVTERTRALELLKQSETELAEIQQLANLGSWSWDIKTGLMTWSDELYRIFGLHPQEIQASFEAGINRVHPEDREDVLRSVERCMSTKERYNKPCRIIRSDGTTRLLHVVGSVVDNEDGTPIRMFGHCQDITELEATKEARRAAELKYRQIFENAGEGIFQSTPEGSYLTANPALARIHGFDSPAELIRSCRDISREIYVDPARRDEFKRLLGEHDVVRGFEHETFRKDGSRIWISINARTVRDESGRIMYYEGTTQDITERKQAEQALRQSEEKYRELFENSKDALYVHDMSGKYLSVNRAAEKLTGYSRDELVGRNFFSFVSSEHVGQVRAQLYKELKASDETTYEVEIVTKQGCRVSVEVSSRLIFEDNKPIGVQGYIRDVSERKRAQEAARTYSRRLIQAQEAERRRISRELHDQVGQILTAVKMNLYALQQNCNAPEILVSIADNMDVIDEAVDQVRDLSVVLRPLLLDDFGLVVALRWYLDRQSKSSGLTAEFITRSLTEDDRFTSELETACFRIVQESVTNVLRHAKATRLSIMLERAGSDLLLLIADDGAGFDTSVLHGPAAGQMTLGLRGMEERVQAVGGALTIESAPRFGTEIWARFPLHEEVRARSPLESRITGLSKRVSTGTSG